MSQLFSGKDNVGNYNLNGRDVILHVSLSLGILYIIPL